MLSPADLRHLKEICRDFDLPVTLLPDYSDTLDGGTWQSYHLIPQGGTTIDDIRACGRARATIECSFVQNSRTSAGAVLKEDHGVSLYRLGLPIGVLQTDDLLDSLAAVSGRPIPEKHNAERGRLVDSLVDGHKYLFDVKAVVFGEEDMVVGVAHFLAEIGVTPVLCASGGTSGQMRTAIRESLPELADHIRVRQGADYAEIEEEIADLKPDLLIGPSKGYKLARSLGIPLIRIGFPIHDRVGGARLLHVGYRGAQQLFDRICNALIERTQETSDVGYSYL
jgi:nitrogenase molybdenum-iron protein NifN